MTLRIVSASPTQALCCCWDALSLLSFFFLSYSNFSPKFALASFFWKHALSNWNFDTTCKMVSIRGRLLSSGNLT